MDVLGIIITLQAALIGLLIFVDTQLANDSALLGIIQLRKTLTKKFLKIIVYGAYMKKVKKN